MEGISPNVDGPLRELVFADPLSLSFDAKGQLIGRGGSNIKKLIARLGRHHCVSDVYAVIKIRLRGRGSGHFESGRMGLAEADIPLQLCLSCNGHPQLFEHAATILLFNA